MSRSAPILAAPAIARRSPSSRFGTRQFAPMIEKASSFSSPASYSLNGGMHRPSEYTSVLSISAGCPPTSDMCETVPRKATTRPRQKTGRRRM